MKQRTLLGRLLSPAGFGLVLICFLLPFVTVSCGTASEKADATFTGLDMATGGMPKVDSPDKNADSAQEIGELVMDEIDLEPLALLAVFAVFGGMAVGIARQRRIRFGAAGAAAVVAVGLTVAAISRVPGHVDQFILNVGGAEGMPEDMSTSNHTRYGFWVAMTILVGLAAGNGLALLRTHRSEDPQPDPADEEEPGRLSLDELT